jgi:glycosyltransferase involved in cell wall biosynthesis
MQPRKLQWSCIVKIVHLTESIKLGKASEFVWTLHKGLLNEGIDSKIISTCSDIHDDTISLVRPYGVIRQRILEFLRMKRITFIFNQKEPYVGLFTGDESHYNIGAMPELYQADIVHLHWITGFINILPFFKQLNPQKQKVVWTLHDINPLSGGCHLAYDCLEFKYECSNCPYLKYNSCNPLLANRIWEKKMKAYGRMPNVSLHFIAPSSWMNNNARMSSLGAANKTHIIPHGIDTTIFYKHDKMLMRNKYNIPRDKFVILFVSEHMHNYNKSLDLLVQSISTLHKDIVLVTCGNPDEYTNNIVPHIHLGFIKDKLKLAQIYSSADCSVVMSRTESFGLTALESIACGTPVLATDVGGLSDIIDDRVTGLLIRDRNSITVKEAVIQMITLVNDNKFKQDAFIDAVKNKFTIRKFVSNHVHVYKEIYNIAGSNI